MNIISVGGESSTAYKTRNKIFHLLKRKGVPVSEDGQGIGEGNRSVIPLQIVVRSVADSSYLKRNPEIGFGTKFEELVVEFFLKTQSKSFKGAKMVHNHPLALIFNGSVFLYNPDIPISSKAPIDSLSERDIFANLSITDKKEEIERIAKKVFRILERAWREKFRYKIESLKIELSLNLDGEIVVYNVMDNDL